jgi:hypothetical protein
MKAKAGPSRASLCWPVGLLQLLLFAGSLAASEGESGSALNQWDALPGKSTGDYLREGATIISTDALMWPDGTSA